MKINDTIYYVYNEFDGCGCVKCKIKEILEDHILIKDEDGITYWIDNDDIGISTRNHPVRFKKWTVMVPRKQYFEVKEWK